MSRYDSSDVHVLSLSSSTGRPLISHIESICSWLLPAEWKRLFCSPWWRGTSSSRTLACISGGRNCEHYANTGKMTLYKLQSWHRTHQEASSSHTCCLVEYGVGKTGLGESWWQWRVEGNTQLPQTNPETESQKIVVVLIFSKGIFLAKGRLGYTIVANPVPPEKNTSLKFHSTMIYYMNIY